MEMVYNHIFLFCWISVIFCALMVPLFIIYNRRKQAKLWTVLTVVCIIMNLYLWNHAKQPDSDYYCPEGDCGYVECECIPDSDYVEDVE